LRWRGFGKIERLEAGLRPFGRSGGALRLSLRSEEKVGCIDPHGQTMAKDGFQTLKTSQARTV
jgi:hypothetical protein